MMLEMVNTTATAIRFHNVTSLGTNLTNSNLTFDAVASFINLTIGFAIRNINTSTDLFVSAAGATDFNATLTPGQTLRIGLPFVSDARNSCISMVNQFGTFPLLIGLLGTILLLAAVIFALVKGFVILRSEGISLRSLFIGLLIILSVAILVIVAIIILGSLCALL